MAQNGYFSSTETVQSLYSAFTLGSVIFQGTNALSQNNANLFWDNINLRLGIGTGTPQYPLQVAQNFNGNTAVNLLNSSTGSSNNSSFLVTNDVGATASLTLFGNAFSGLPALQNVARLSGSSGVWIASDVNVGASGGSDPISFSVGGYNNITAQATTNGLTAINLTDTGIPASAAGAPLSITYGQVIKAGITYSETASTTPVAYGTGGTIVATYTPAAGTYLCIFSGNIIATSAAGNTLSVGILYNSAYIASSVKQSTPQSGGAFSAFQFMQIGTNCIVTTNGTASIQVGAYSSAGTVTMNNTTFDVIRIA